jgi:formate--tetrahydrofolate ligase
VKSDLEIAQEARIKPISVIARSTGLHLHEIEPYGAYKAKICCMEVLKRLKDKPEGKIILITAITPTPLGEGKTVTTIGLGMALNRLGKKAITTLRQPSMGPVFGIKGGATGGGYSQVIPMEDINLHFTGDTHAVSLANNLLSAFIDNHIFHGNKLGIDPHSITFNRCVDVNDRSLRNVVIGLGGREDGVPRQASFDIAAASEVMAILALAMDLKDLRRRLGRIVLGWTYDKRPVTAEDLKCAGSMAALLRDAIKPNLVQTLENDPAIIHAGPFANIAHGNNSILADKVAMKLADYVVTESGFGADCGAEKFMDIKCRVAGYRPSCVVIVASIRALKEHGGAYSLRPGKPYDKAIFGKENVEAVRKGCVNLAKHIENMRLFGVPVVVAVNRFTADTEAEIEVAKREAMKSGADEAVTNEVWANGGNGGLELAKAVMRACEKRSEFEFLYPLEASIEQKIETIALKIYGADGVDYTTTAETSIRRLSKHGFDKLPVCMAKTHLSISDDPRLKGAPKGWRLTVRDVKVSAGAGFLYALCGEMRTMPGLPTEPAGTKVDIDDKGKVSGLF